MSIAAGGALIILGVSSSKVAPVSADFLTDTASRQRLRVLTLNDSTRPRQTRGVCRRKEMHTLRAAATIASFE